MVRPLYCLSGSALVQIPDSNAARARRGSEDIAGPVDGEGGIWSAFLPRRDRGRVAGCVVGVPELDAVGSAGEELLVVGEG